MNISTGHSIAFAIASIVSLAFITAALPYHAAKNYTVTLSLEEWNSATIAMNNAREIMKNSTLPANVVNIWTDSLINIQTKISGQILAQMRKDGTLPTVEELKKHSASIQEDSTNKPKK